MPTGTNLEAHGAYRVDRLIRTDAIDGRTSLGKRRRVLRDEYTLAMGYPSWSVAPAPTRAAVDNAIRAQLVCERMFSPFWSGGEIPARYSTLAEHLRRQLADLGLEPRGASIDVAAALAAIQKTDRASRARPGAAETQGGAS